MSLVLRTAPVPVKAPVCGAVLYSKIKNNKDVPGKNEWVFGVHNGKIVSTKKQSDPSIGLTNGRVVLLHHVSGFDAKKRPIIETLVFLPTKETYINALNLFGFHNKKNPKLKRPWTTAFPVRIFGFWVEFTATQPTTSPGCFAYRTTNSTTKKSTVHNGKLTSWTDTNGVAHQLKPGSKVPTDASKVTSITYNHWNLRPTKTKTTIVAGQFELVEEQVTVSNTKTLTTTAIGPIT